MAEAPIPDDWPELRASFVLGMRAAWRSPRTISGYVGSCDQFARFLVATQLGHKSLKMLGRYGRVRATERSRDDFFRTSER